MVFFMVWRSTWPYEEEKYGEVVCTTPMVLFLGIRGDFIDRLNKKWSPAITFNAS
jgi:hypothetical protein